MAPPCGPRRDGASSFPPSPIRRADRREAHAHLADRTSRGGDRRIREAEGDPIARAPGVGIVIALLAPSEKERKGWGPIGRVDRDLGFALAPAPSDDPAGRVLERLRASGYLAHRDLACEVRGGVAVLSGRLRSRHHKQVAQAIADSVEGVRRVDNRIEVVPAGPPEGRGRSARSWPPIAIEISPGRRDSC